MAESPKDISGLGLDELKALLVQALEESARLKAENAELREEIARLKGLKGRPKLKPSGMEKATETPAARSAKRKGRRGAKRTKLAIDETRIVKPHSLPAGARFKGYEDFIVGRCPCRGRSATGSLAASSGVVVAALPKPAASRSDEPALVLSQYPGASRPALERAACGPGPRYLQAADRAAVERKAGRLPCRSPRSAARRPRLRPLD
jgi:hypothetical protein